MTTIDYKELTWRSTSLLCDKALEITNAKNLCLRRLGALSGKHERPASRSLEEQNSMLLGQSLSKRSESNRWKADGARVEQLPRIHCIGNSLKRNKHLWQKYSVNLSNSKTGSSSCQCTTILCGEKKETQKNILRIMLRLRIMLADSCSDVGHVWCLDQRRIGTELTLINQMETGIRLLN